MTINVDKRTKRFYSFFGNRENHPYFKKIFLLYLNDTLKTITQVQNRFNKIKIKKDGGIYKKDIKNADIIDKQYKQYKEDKKKNKISKYIQSEYIVDINEDNFTNDFGKDNFGFWTHTNNILNAMKNNPDTIIIHKLEFYINNKKQTKYINVKAFGNIINIDLINDPKKFTFTNTNLTKKQIEEQIIYNLTFGGSGFTWIVDGFRDYNKNDQDDTWSVKLITTAYKRITNDNNQLYLLQKYAFNNNGTCVYDGLLEFFSKYLESKSKHAIAIYNKLIKNPNKYAKAYTIEDMESLGQDINCSFTINDLINNKDIEINKNSFNNYNIHFVNTRYNHLDLLKCVSDVQEVSTDYYEHYKEDSPFYIERLGTLLTLDGNFKINNEYHDVVNEWKEKYNINSCSIEINSDINKFINCYDDKVHRFFNPQMEINDDLYNELDLKKAYYNYHKCDYYHGLPSGAYISCSGDGMTDKILMEQGNHGLVGFYEVIVIHDNEILNYIGMKTRTKHILFSTTIMLLLVEYNVKFIYLNYVISPSIHAPFNENFLKYIDNDTLTDNDNAGVRVYCKITGCMMIENTNFIINVKPNKNDKEYYKTLTQSENLFFVDGVYKIVKKQTTPKSLKHMALSIHAISSTIILQQLLKMKKDDIYGVKVDSIVFKKDAIFKYDNELFKSPGPANVKNMLIDDDYEDSTKFTIVNEYFKPYFKESLNKINFDKSFCGEHITRRVIMLGGAGGCGKTHSILSSKNFMIDDLLFTSTCWELIQGKVDEFNITGISLPKLSGEMNGKVVEKFNSNKYKYIVNDELTLQSEKGVNNIITDNPNKFIILMGDIDEDGFYYQCSIGSNVFSPSRIGTDKLQYIKYTKNYRFDEPFNNKINDLRAYMKKYKGKTGLLHCYVKKHFSECFKKFKQIEFNENDVGISALKPIGKDGKCLYSHHFYKRGAKEQYYVKDTYYKKGLYRGAKLDEEPDNKNYINSLFRTIHAYQGRQLTQDNKIIILLNSLFDFNLLYTAISRARRLDQVIILDMIKK